VPDQRLQRLHRAWRASSSSEDEALWLRERVRVGELTPARLRLAANCGHLAARLALEEPADDPDPDLARWVYQLGGGRRDAWLGESQRVFRMIALCAAELALDAWSRTGASGEGPWLVLEALRVWAQREGEVPQRAVHEAYVHLAHPSADALSLPRAADRQQAVQTLEVLRIALTAFACPAPPRASAASAARYAGALTDPERVRQEVAARVIAWALATPGCAA